MCLCVGGCRLRLYLLENESVCVFVRVGGTRWVIEHSFELMDVFLWVFVWTDTHVGGRGCVWVCM